MRELQNSTKYWIDTTRSLTKYTVRHTLVFVWSYVVLKQKFMVKVFYWRSCQWSKLPIFRVRVCRNKQIKHRKNQNLGASYLTRKAGSLMTIVLSSTLCYKSFFRKYQHILVGTGAIGIKAFLSKVSSLCKGTSHVLAFDVSSQKVGEIKSDLDNAIQGPSGSWGFMYME